MSLIMAGEATEAQIGAFIMVRNRVHADMVAAGADVMRLCYADSLYDASAVDIVGTGGIIAV